MSTHFVVSLMHQPDGLICNTVSLLNHTNFHNYVYRSCRRYDGHASWRLQRGTAIRHLEKTIIWSWSRTVILAASEIYMCTMGETWCLCCVERQYLPVALHLWGPCRFDLLMSSQTLHCMSLLVQHCTLQIIVFLQQAFKRAYKPFEKQSQCLMGLYFSCRVWSRFPFQEIFGTAVILLL